MIAINDYIMYGGKGISSPGARMSRDGEVSAVVAEGSLLCQGGVNIFSSIFQQ